MYAYIFLLLGTNMLLFPRFFFNFLEILVITVLIPFLNWYNVNRYTIQVKYVNNVVNYNPEDYNKDEEDEEDGEDEEDNQEEGEQEEGEQEEGEQEEGQESTEGMQNDFKKPITKVKSCNTVCGCDEVEKPVKLCESIEIEKPTKLCDIKCPNYMECECRMNQLSNLPTLPDSPTKVPFYVEYDLD